MEFIYLLLRSGFPVFMVMESLDDLPIDHLPMVLKRDRRTARPIHGQITDKQSNTLTNRQRQVNRHVPLMTEVRAKSWSRNCPNDMWRRFSLVSRLVPFPLFWKRRLLISRELGRSVWLPPLSRGESNPYVMDKYTP